MTTSIKTTSPEDSQSHIRSWALDFAILGGLCLILFFYKLGSYPLFDLDEPRYAEAGREMLESGNWITPYFNYTFRFEKPIFFYWLIAWAYQLFGVNEFAARFFSAVTASLTVGSVYAFGRHLVSRQYGFFAALILATSVLFAGIARMSITDMTLACFMTGTTLCLFLAAHRNLKWWIGAGLIAGLGILTKGPVALIVPGAIFTIYTLLTSQLKRCLLNRWLFFALTLALSISVPWYVAVYQQNGPQVGTEFLQAQFMNNVTRYSDVVSGHKQPPYFYTLVLLAGFLPWTFYLPAALRQLWQQFRESHQQHVKQTNLSYLVPLYALTWIAFVFAFFSLGSTKLLTYILPLFPALALLVASVWIETPTKTESEPVSSRWLSFPAAISTFSILIGGLVFITNMDRLLPREAAGVQGNTYNLIAVFVLLLGASLTTWLLTRQQRAKALKAQALTIVLLVIVALQGIVPNISKATQGVMMDYLSKTGNAPLMLYEIQRTSLTFYGKRRVPRFVEEQQAEMLKELQKNTVTYVITKNTFHSQFQELLPATFTVSVIEKDPVYSLLSVRKAP